MSKIAFLFPGQGSQYVGMGKDFYDTFEKSKAVYDLAGKVAGIDMEKLCFEENEDIHSTEYTQIAILATEIAMYVALRECGIDCDVSAGLSLGEYGALIAAGAMSMESAFDIVCKRGRYMQEEVPTGGAMAAIVGLNGEFVSKECQKHEGLVSVANYNCPGQVVISGEAWAVNDVSERLSELGASGCVGLNVSGPFHSILLKGAGEKLGMDLEKIAISQPKIPYVSNVTGGYVHDAKDVKNLLIEQVYSCVKWQQCVENMISNGVETFIQVGPGKTLTRFLRKINKDMNSINIQSVTDLNHAIRLLKSN